MSSFPATSEQEQSGRLTPAVQVLIAINVAVMFVQWTAVKYTDVWRGSVSIRRRCRDAGGRRLRTCSCMRASGISLANMYALYLFGPRLEQAWGTRKFSWFYLLCGLGGVVFQLLFIRVGGLIGASAAVFGVMTAYAMQWPDDEVYLMFVLPDASAHAGGRPVRVQPRNGHCRHG